MDSKGVTWKRQRIVLTEDKVLFSKLDQDNGVFDFVNLSEIVECEIKADEENDQQQDNIGIRRNSEWKVPMLEVIIRTTDDGYNGGRSYIYRTEYNDAISWEADIDRAVAKAKARALEDLLHSKYGHSLLSMARARVHQAYKSKAMQFGVAVLIIIAFIVDVTEAQVLPLPASTPAAVFFWMDVGITAMFTADLAVNLFAHSDKCFLPFYSNKNNLFDTAIVIISITSVLIDVYGQGNVIPIKMVRVVRVVRVTRFFPHFQQLNRLVQAIGHCIIPMLNALLILLVFTIMYAVVATKLFRDRRPEFFGDFSASLFTMFQIVMGDSWGSAITRSLFEVEDDAAGTTRTDTSVAFFFISYVMIGSVTLLNVVIAVLLDELIATVGREKEAAALLVEADNDKRRIKGVLDLLTSQLTAFEDPENLIERIDDLYHRLDSDQSGGLNYLEFKSLSQPLLLFMPASLSFLLFCWLCVDVQSMQRCRVWMQVESVTCVGGRVSRGECES